MSSEETCSNSSNFLVLLGGCDCNHVNNLYVRQGGDSCRTEEIWLVKWLFKVGMCRESVRKDVNLNITAVIMS